MARRLGTIQHSLLLPTLAIPLGIFMLTALLLLTQVGDEMNTFERNQQLTD
jgi:hypothetical protein